MGILIVVLLGSIAIYVIGWFIVLIGVIIKTIIKARHNNE